MRACGTVILATCIALLGLVVAVFATVFRPHAVDVRGVESARDPFAFYHRHQLDDSEIGIVEFVGGYTAGGAVTVAAAGRRGCCNVDCLQLRHGGKNFVVLQGGWPWPVPPLRQCFRWI